MIKRAGTGTRMEKTFDKQDKRNMCIAFGVIALLTVIPAFFLHISWTFDELGTLANSAYLAGYDWSYPLHVAGGYYYKYGTALFYALPFLLIKDSILLYRVMMAINGVLLGITAASAYVICRRHLGVKKSGQALWMALISAGTPSALLHSSYGRGDFVLVLTPWLVLLCLLEAYRSAGRRKIIFSVLCALAAVYAFMGHTRGVVLMIALFMTVAGARLLLGIRAVHMPAYLCATGAGLLLDRFLTSFFKQAIWGQYGARHASVEGARFSDLGTLFTLDGIKVLIKSVLGWLYTIFSSTMGLACVGLVIALMLILLLLQKKRAASDEVLLTSVLGALHYGGSVAMGILFFYPYIYDALNSMNTKRYDRIFYGRYQAGAVGLICLLAVYALAVRRDLFGIRTKIVSCAVFAVTLFVFCKSIAGPLAICEYDKKQVIELGTFTKLIKDPVHRMIAAGILGMTVFVLWLLLLHLKKLRLAAPMLILFAFLAVYSASYSAVRLGKDKNLYASADEAYHMVLELDIDEEQYLYILLANRDRYWIRGFQPLLKEYNVIVRNGKNLSKFDDMIYISTNGRVPKRSYPKNAPLYLIERDDYRKGGCRLYVKGERLKNYLEEKGWTLSLYGGT